METKLILVVDAARLLGVHRTTITRSLRQHIVKKLHGGRHRDYVALDRVRHMASMVADEPASVSADIREIREQISALEKAQIRLARGLGKLAHVTGVRV